MGKELQTRSKEIKHQNELDYTLQNLDLLGVRCCNLGRFPLCDFLKDSQSLFSRSCALSGQFTFWIRKYLTFKVLTTQDLWLILIQCRLLAKHQHLLQMLKTRLARRLK